MSCLVRVIIIGLLWLLLRYFLFRMGLAIFSQTTVMFSLITISKVEIFNFLCHVNVVLKCVLKGIYLTALTPHLASGNSGGFLRSLCQKVKSTSTLPPCHAGHRESWSGCRPWSYSEVEGRNPFWIFIVKCTSC